MEQLQAQKRLYLLYEVYGELEDQIKHLDARQKQVNAQRRELLMQFPALDIRRPSRLPDDRLL